MINVNCQSSIKIKESKILYFDPLKMNEVDTSDKADIIFITHPHYDHFDINDIKLIKKDSTKIVGPKDILDKCIDIFDKDNIIIIEPNNTITIDNIKITTVPAYNLNKNFHKKEYNWLGYVIELDNKKYYIAGDTDYIEENTNIDCDIAFIPIGGVYTMDHKEAADFVNKLKPKQVVPIHYGMIVGTYNDFLHFKESVNVEVLELIEVN